MLMRVVFRTEICASYFLENWHPLAELTKLVLKIGILIEVFGYAVSGQHYLYYCYLYSIAKNAIYNFMNKSMQVSKNTIKISSL